MLIPARIDFISGIPDPSASFETNYPIEAESIVKKIQKKTHIKYL